jgi:hypothetical protein
MRLAWAIVALACAACASILGVDHDFTLGSDAGAGGLDPGVRCGSGNGPSYCATPAQECCLSDDGGLACIQLAGVSSPCPGGTDIECDDSADCPSGQACCINLDSQSYILSTLCAPACGSMQPRLCDPSASQPCGSGTCAALTVANPTIGWFHACQ